MPDQPKQDDSAPDFTIVGTLSDDAWNKIAETVNKAQKNED